MTDASGTTTTGNLAFPGYPTTPGVNADNCLYVGGVGSAGVPLKFGNVLTMRGISFENIDQSLIHVLQFTGGTTVGGLPAYTAKLGTNAGPLTTTFTCNSGINLQAYLGP